MADHTEIIENLHEAYLAELLRKIQSGEATAADLNVARQVCKEHGITAVPGKNKALGAVIDTIPDMLTDEYTAH